MKGTHIKKGSAWLVVFLLAGFAGVAAGCSREDPNAVPPPSQQANPLPSVEHAYHKPKLPPLAGPGAQRSAAMTPPKGP